MISVKGEQMTANGGSAHLRYWKRLLIVGHHGRLDLMIRRVLEGEAFRVDICDAPADAEILCGRRSVDLLILLSDWPKYTREFVRGVRQFSRIPILVVCDPGTEPAPDIIDAGADDVVSFGVAMTELRARALALLRRAKPAFTRDRQLIAEGIWLDLGRQRLQLGERALQLTNGEFRFLLALADKPGNVVAYNDLAEAVWGSRLHEEGAIRALVKRLRLKLDEARGLVQVQYGVGYYLEASSCVSPVRA